MCLNEVFRPEYLSEYFEISIFGGEWWMPGVSFPLATRPSGRLRAWLPDNLKVGSWIRKTHKTTD